MIEHFTGEEISPSIIPSQFMYLRLKPHNYIDGDVELMEFTSELSSTVSDQTRTFIFDYHYTLGKMKESV